MRVVQCLARSGQFLALVCIRVGSPVLKLVELRLDPAMVRRRHDSVLILLVVTRSRGLLLRQVFPNLLVSGDLGR